MTGKADVQTHLNHRRPGLQTLFSEWAALDLSAGDRANIVEAYFKGTEIGDLQRVGNGHSVHISPTGLDSKRANVLVVGRHDIHDLSPATATSVPDASLLGPGLASRLGPNVAFCEGFQAARSLTVDGPVNMSFLSLGEGDSFGDVSSQLFTGNLDAVYLTDAVAWNPFHPTLTVGARGQLVVQLRLDAGGATNDFVASGAVRNPLSKMVQLLGSLRDDRGRIALPNFYERAHAPDAGVRAALVADDHDPNEWTEHLGAARFSAGLSMLERASLWPGVSVLAIESGPSDGQMMPSSVTATLAVYLVPDQRHVETERALRSWFLDQAPDDLQPSLKVLTSSRPLRSAPDSRPVAAQARAAFQLYGRHPVQVQAGGPAGAGEIAFAIGAPVAFAGIAQPSTSYGTRAESLSWSHFDAGVAMAAETCLQLRRG